MTPQVAHVLLQIGAALFLITTFVGYVVAGRNKVRVGAQPDPAGPMVHSYLSFVSRHLNGVQKISLLSLVIAALILIGIGLYASR